MEAENKREGSKEGDRKVCTSFYIKKCHYKSGIIFLNLSINPFLSSPAIVILFFTSFNNSCDAMFFIPGE